MMKFVKWVTAAGIAGSMLAGPIGSIAEARVKPETHMVAKHKAAAKRPGAAKQESKLAKATKASAKVAKKGEHKRLSRASTKKSAKAARRAK